MTNPTPPAGVVGAELGLWHLKTNFGLYAQECLKILPKAGGTSIPFVFNKAQRYIDARLDAQLETLGYVRALVLKSRQQGSSTYIGARFYHKATMDRGQGAFIVAHEDKATSNLFKMVKRYHDYNPIAPSTKASNAQELIFGELDGGYKLATAGSKDVGRSNTARLFHGCLGAGAIVLMADGGIKTIESLEPGDMVRTKSGDAAPVKGVSWHSDVTHNVTIAKSNIELRATDSHKFWTRRGMLRLDELAVGDELGFPVRAITGEVTTAPFASELAVRSHGGGRREAQGPKDVDLNFETGRMLGLYLAEGYISLQSKEPHSPNSVVFACHERELERNNKWVRCVGMYSSLNTGENKGSKTRMTVAYGKQFASFVHRMCGRLSEKHLPHEWWKMPREFVQGLLIGYLAGDGHSSPDRDRRIQAPSIVPAIAFGMRDVAASLGYGFGGVTHRPAGVRNGRNEKAQYTLRITGSGVDSLATLLGWEMPHRKRDGNQIKIEDGFAWLPIKSISGVIHETVYDIEVDHPDHDYCLAQCATSNSEFAFWDNAQMHLAGIGETIPSGALGAGTEMILESTANGLGNAFHLMWQAAEAGVDEEGNPSEWIAIFVPWFWQEEYRTDPAPGFKLSAKDEKYRDAYGLDLAQMQWRANKIAGYGKNFEWLFDQEYPACAALAFKTSTKNPLISPNDVQAAINSQYFDVDAPLIIGVDPAGDGEGKSDRTAFAFRCGRTCFRIEYHNTLTTMQIAGKLAGFWSDGVEVAGRKLWPDAIIVDKGGIGTGIVDRLRELNVPVIGVMFAQSASDPAIYLNKRAEMWWAMKAWFEDAPCRMPNEAQLMSDLCAPQPVENSHRKKQLESKKEMAKRQIRSPDGGDALALTFAEPVAARNDGASRSRNPNRPATSAGY